MYLSILKEFYYLGDSGNYVYIIYVSFNIKRGFYYLGGCFWNYVAIYIYIYVSFNIKRGFYYLGDSGNYVYLYMYLYLSILKEAFIIWGLVFGDVFLYLSPICTMS